MKTKVIMGIMLMLFLMSMFSVSATAIPEKAVMRQELAQVRQATTKYHDEAEALADGYVPVSPHVPGMGAHYINFAILDETFDLEHPEILLYSLTEGDGPKLVGMEYVVTSIEAPEGFPGDSDEWEIHPASCHYEDGYEIVEPNPVNCPATSPGGAPLALWHPDLQALHVWIWRANPDGIFEPFNPNVP